VKTGQSLKKMSKPTVLHTEGTAQFNISDSAKKLYSGKNNSGIAVVINCKQGLTAEIHFHHKSKGRRGKGKSHA